MIAGYTGLKVFCATRAQDREKLGETVTAWLREHSELEVVHTVVNQSSDEAFHCISIVIFWRQR